MAVLSSFLTHVGLTIRHEKTGRVHLVSIEGEVKKPLYEGEDAAEATESYDNAVAHYTDRQAKAEEDKRIGDCNASGCPIPARHPSHLENNVFFVPRRTREAEAWRTRVRGGA